MLHVSLIHSLQPPKFSPADIFRRGIKRDSNLFPILKDEKLNDSWHRSFATQARAQDVGEVLDIAYTPTNDEERDLFQEKQKFVYAILEAKVLTNRGKVFVCEHENDFDAQAVYKKLVDHHLCSTKAMIDSSHHPFLCHFSTTWKWGVAWFY